MLRRFRTPATPINPATLRLLLAAYREQHESLPPAALITPRQCRAARVGLALSIEGFAARAGITPAVVASFESHGIGDGVLRRNFAETLQMAGAGFVAEGGLEAVVFRS